VNVSLLKLLKDSFSKSYLKKAKFCRSAGAIRTGAKKHRNAGGYTTSGKGIACTLEPAFNAKNPKLVLNLFRDCRKITGGEKNSAFCVGDVGRLKRRTFPKFHAQPVSAFRFLLSFESGPGCCIRHNRFILKQDARYQQPAARHQQIRQLG